MKVICRIVYYNRYCNISGIFIEEKDIVDYVLEREFEIYGGELAGKHSSIDVLVNKDTLKIISDNQEAVRMIEELGLENGFNPFDYSHTDYNDNEYDTFREYITKQLQEFEDE